VPIGRAPGRCLILETTPIKRLGHLRDGRLERGVRADSGPDDGSSAPPMPAPDWTPGFGRPVSLDYGIGQASRFGVGEDYRYTSFYVGLYVGKSSFSAIFLF
jgi:hypothetical protein